MSLTVLVIDDEANFRKNASEFLEESGYEVAAAGTIAEGREFLKKGIGDIILLDIQLPDGYGPAFMDEISIMPTRPFVIMVTAFGDIDTAVEAMRKGAHDFLTKPLKFEQLEKSLERAGELVSMRRELEQYRQSQVRNTGFLIGKSKKMLDTLEKARRAAAAGVSVLITGETGTGKEVVANYIHRSGPRSKKPFMPINCAAIQETMIESELFGHEAGAFTGADKRKPGLMEVADTGVLFLDEISSMSMDMQSKLLRVLEERVIRRVGGAKLIPVDVQVIAASNKDLLSLIKDGRFREDLYYRLHVIDLEVPPLRERREDIPEFVGYFLREKNAQMGLNITNISPAAMKALQKYDWPGNIRELKNAIERAILFCDEDTIDLYNLPGEIVKENKQ